MVASRGDRAAHVLLDARSGRARRRHAGAFHGSEIYYVFNSLAANPERPWTHNDRTIAGVVSSYVSNFLKTGDPNGGHLPVWRRFDGEPLTMELGDAFSPRAVASATELDFFRRFFAARPKR